MKEILESIQPVIAISKSVRINDEAIAAFVASIQSTEVGQIEFDFAAHLPEPTQERHLAFITVFNAINFCYWGDPKWTIERDGKMYDGSYGLTQACLKALLANYPLLNPQFLATISEADLMTILAGTITIPLFQERLELLRNTGRVLIEKFDSQWQNILTEGNNDAVEIVRVLVNNFPMVFKDEAIYDGHPVKFYKRAQLIPASLHFALAKRGLFPKLTNTDQLTAFADYKVPQILRKLGVLEYVPGLAEKVDGLIELPAGSPEEVEIRAHTIEAIERATRLARNVFPEITAAEVDTIVWLRGQLKSPDDKPYHRTRTIWY